MRRCWPGGRRRRWRGGPAAGAARELAEANGSQAVGSLEELWERCEAVAFAVPPDVQAELATAAARAGRHLLLDKPVALTVGGGRGPGGRGRRGRVVSQMVLTNRYGPRGRAFLAAAEGFEVVGARCASLSGALLGDSPFSTPWRRRHGALLDVGPHLFDLLEGRRAHRGAVGAGRGDPLRWVSLTCRHAGGQVSELSMSLSLPLAETVFECVLYGPRVAGLPAGDRLAVGGGRARGGGGDPPPGVRRGRDQRGPSALDVNRGVRLQRLIDAAARSLG